MLTIGTCPIDINCAKARLIAADWFEEQGRSEEAKLLKQTGKSLFYTNKVVEKVEFCKTHPSFKKYFKSGDLSKCENPKKIKISKSFTLDGLEESDFYLFFLSKNLLGLYTNGERRRIKTKKDICILKTKSRGPANQYHLEVIYVHPEDCHYFGITIIPAFVNETPL